MPVLVIKGAWMGFVVLTGMPSGTSGPNTFAINTLLISLAVVWLMADRLCRVPRPLKWPLAFVLFAAVTGLSMPTLGFDIRTILVLVNAILLWSVLLSALPFGALMSRRKWHPVRFVIWAAVWIFAAIPLLVLAFAAIQMGSRLFSPGYLLQIFTAELVVSAILAAGLLPFEILWFTSGFWRQRFEKLLLLRTRPTTKPVEQVEAAVES